jgi:antitoxin StbD
MATTNAIYANATVSITELRRNPSQVIEEAHTGPVAILNHNRATAYLVSAKTYEAMMELLEDAQLAKLVKSRRGGPTRKVTLDEL